MLGTCIMSCGFYEFMQNDHVFCFSYTRYGAKVVGNRTGIFFNNEMDDFSNPNMTNFFGLPPSPANFIKPYKRPMSSMTPAIVLGRTNDAALVTGASGGTRIITSTALVRGFHW